MNIKLTSALLLASGSVFSTVSLAGNDPLLEQRLQSLEQELQTLKAQSVRTENGALMMGDTALTVGGYIKADVLYSSNGVNAKNALLAAAHVKAADENKSSRWDMTARESRFFLKTTSQVDGKALTTFLEADFYGSDGTESVSNAHGLRLRHAYGSWGNLLIGQTWSTFMDLAALGDLNAFGQHASAIFVRQTQVRYTQPFSGGNLMLAMENPEDGGDDQSSPDLVARVNLDGGWGHASLAAVSRQMSDGVDHTRASAFSATAKFPFAGGDDVRLQFSKGSLGRYMGLAIYPDENAWKARLQGYNSEGGSVAVRHVWSPALASTLMVSRTSTSERVDGGAIDSAKSIHANLMWTAASRVRFGAEWAKWDVKTVNASVSDDKSVSTWQLSSRYLF
jgi:hypothetical protein